MKFVSRAIKNDKYEYVISQKSEKKSCDVDTIIEKIFKRGKSLDGISVAQVYKDAKKLFRIKDILDDKYVLVNVETKACVTVSKEDIIKKLVGKDILLENGFVREQNGKLTLVKKDLHLDFVNETVESDTNVLLALETAIKSKLPTCKTVLDILKLVNISDADLDIIKKDLYTDANIVFYTDAVDTYIDNISVSIMNDNTIVFEYKKDNKTGIVALSFSTPTVVLSELKVSYIPKTIDWKV